MSDIGDSEVSDSDSSLHSDSEDGSDSDGDQLQEFINSRHQNSLDKKLLDAARDGKLHKIVRLLEEARGNQTWVAQSLHVLARSLEPPWEPDLDSVVPARLSAFPRRPTGMQLPA